jgi:hypothetical protein
MGVERGDGAARHTRARTVGTARQDNRDARSQHDPGRVGIGKEDQLLVQHVAGLISDIYLDGAISEVATRRSEFGTILKNEGIDGLIAALNRKVNLLTATTANSF